MSTVTEAPAKSTRKSTKNAVKRGPGRPAVELNFNFGKNAFTVKSVLDRYAKNPEKKISAVAITQKLKKLINNGTPNKDGKIMMIVGKKIVGRGRPFLLFKYVTPEEARRIRESQEAATSAE